MEQPLAIYRSSPMRDAGRSGSAMRRRAAGEGPERLVRVGPNAFVRGAEWDAAGPRQKYVTRVFARLGRRSTAAVASHVSAAAVHGLPWLTGWPEDVHITVPKSQYRSRPGPLVLHTRSVSSGDVVDHLGLAFTSVARTVADIALTGDTRSAVVVADAALRRGTTRQHLFDALGGQPHHRGRSAAALSLELADGRSGSVAESLARVVFRELGLPAPVLQQEFVVRGSRFAVDFWFPEEGVIVEIDGRAKYTQGRYRSGRSATDVFVDEKRRHEQLLMVPAVRTIVRLEWRDLWDLDALAARLRRAGLPCVRRPVRSARGLAV
ncbi:hypothetical protein KK101_09755 [Curtobacterium flaccumfaciens pv. oortii]|uniref:hypothetical protein n=1 Tax=Curtobacterium flaccumfaciens TaxID=2035 RepID=UPI001BDF1BDA|nr:hypothetical protein [Curtobacterium flaccumfaciens]MBT1622967.1 hypothetical protein [Curtobacterium flaccumfaciens pv. oortii]